MFDVAIWGNVANWTEALSTGLAALIAAITYSANVRNAKYAQARRVRAQLSGGLFGQTRSIKILNDSDRRIGGLYLLWIEMTVKEALLRNRSKTFPVTFTLPQYGTWKPTAAPMTLYAPRPLKDLHKKDFIGYAGRGGVQISGDVPRFIEPGEEAEITVPEDHQEYGVGYDGPITYWVGFQDANGRIWERAATNHDYEGLGRLRKGYFGSNAEMTKVMRMKGKRDPLKKLKYYSTVFYWLYKNRDESPPTAPPGAASPPANDSTRGNDSTPQTASNVEDDGPNPPTPPLTAGRFELFKDKSGAFRFRLKAANGKIIASSQGYETKASAEKGIESVKANAPGAPVVDLTEREPGHNLRVSPFISRRP